MKTRMYLLLICLSSLGNLFAQPSYYYDLNDPGIDIWPMASAWSKVPMLRSTNADFVASSNTWVSSMLGDKVWMLSGELNSGNIHWSNYYQPSPSMSSLEQRDAKKLPNGNMVFSYTKVVPANQQKGLLICINSNGVVQWSKKTECPIEAMEVLDDRIVIGGTQVLPERYVIVQLDFQGNELAVHEYIGQLPNPSQHIYDITATSDGGFIILNLSQRACTYSIELIKISSDLSSVSWASAYCSNTLFWPPEIIEAPQGYIMAGSQRIGNSNVHNGLVVKLNTSGNIVWQRELVVPYVSDVNQLADHSLILHDLMIVEEKLIVTGSATGIGGAYPIIGELTLSGEPELFSYEYGTPNSTRNEGTTLLPYIGNESMYLGGARYRAGKGFSLALSEFTYPGFQKECQDEFIMDANTATLSEVGLHFSVNPIYHFVSNRAVVVSTAKVEQTDCVESTPPNPYRKGALDRPEFRFTLQPNPTHGKVIIESNSDEQSPAEVIIFNSMGQKMYAQIFEPGKKWKLNLNHLSTGLYLLSITQGKHTDIQKLWINP